MDSWVLVVSYSRLVVNPQVLVRKSVSKNKAYGSGGIMLKVDLWFP